MSRLAGLARTNTAENRKNESSPSSSATLATPASSASAADTAPSLSALASGAQARPRQSLAGLGRLGASSSSSSGGIGVRAGAPSPSLSSLASARREGHDRPSLQDLAKGSSGGLVGSHAGSGLGGASSRPSLASLAQSRKTLETAPNAGAASSSTRTSLSQLSSISVSANGSTSSLGQLASKQTLSPRRPLAILATATPNKAPAPSSASLLSKTTTPTATVSEKAPIGKASHTQDHLTLPTAPTLSSLSSSSLQQGASLETLDSSVQSSENDGEYLRSQEQETTTAYTPVSTSITTSNIEPDPQLSSSTTTTQPQLYMHEANSVVVPDSSFDADAAPAFSSLIAPPSHFAVSIFERLDPAPSPIALTTASILESGTALLGGGAVGATATSWSSTGAITPARIFRFDVPSPDDIVFKAQGQRPVVNSPLSKDSSRT
ncbi:hypothetical protein EC968_008062 [Mortierella alpina]|nr:hypothetical protein EC968_008062 [Mortierella alpina]